MSTLMAAPAARQPFAPIDSSRLQKLTSLKNRQNAFPMNISSPIKRKAQIYEDDNDSENIDPVKFFSPKRSKATESAAYAKPSTLFLTKPPIRDIHVEACKPVKTSNISRPILQARSQAPTSKLQAVDTTSILDKTLSAPAGRSPTRKRAGLLNSRRTTANGGSPFTRIDPPRFGGAQSVEPFSIAAALRGSIPSYATRTKAEAEPALISKSSSKKDSWFFEIHEDSEADTMQILMEHSTCTLDLSSDEETHRRMHDERGKENVPPLDDVSQSQARLPRGDRARQEKIVDENAIELDRSPLSDLEAEEFYAEGCCVKDVVLVADEEAEGIAEESSMAQQQEPPLSEQEQEQVPQQAADSGYTAEAQFKGKGRLLNDVSELMFKSDAAVPAKAAFFTPVEKAEDNFEVWESGSAKGDE